MVETIAVAALPLAPKSPLPYLQRMKATRAYHTGCETLRDRRDGDEIQSRPQMDASADRGHNIAERRPGCSQP